MKLLIIVPAYNEAESIVKVIEELQEKVPQFDYIIVNDRLENAVENILELIYRHRRHLREGTPDDPSKLD